MGAHHHICSFVHHLFSVEQKKVTQGLSTLLSDEGGRYMASEKQVSNNLSNSVLKRVRDKDIKMDKSKRSVNPTCR